MAITITIPTITSFSPASGPIGTTLIITGTNFSTTPANNIVYFGAVRANVTAATATQLTVTVPVGATYSPISVLDISTGLLGRSKDFFTPTFSPSNGTITPSYFEPRIDINMGFPFTFSYSVAIGDLDGDGKSDLAAVNSDNSTNFAVSVLRNTSSNGSLSYAPRIDFATGPFPSSVVLGDLDGDGKLDIAVTNGSNATVSVFRNTSSAGLISFNTKVDFITGSQPTAVAIGDLDGDGKNDLAITNQNVFNPSISLLRNTGTIGAINFAAKIDLNVIFIRGGVAINDIDGDGKADLAATVGNDISIFRNIGSSGNISFATSINVGADNSGPIAAGDVDGDGKLDLVTGNLSSTATMYVFRNTSTIGNISYAGGIGFTTAGANVYSVALGDLNGDGSVDLAAISVDAGSVSLFRNTSTAGTINLDAKVDFSTGPQPWSLAIGDLDGDGKSDLAVAKQSGSNTLSILRTGSIIKPTITAFSPASGPIGTTVTINGTNFSTTPANNIVYFGAVRANVTAATAAQLTVTVPAGATFQPITVQVAGLTAYSAKPFVVTFAGGGSIDACSFAPQVVIRSNPTLGPISATLVDLDGDGKVEIINCDEGNTRLSITRNISSPGSLSIGSFVPEFTLPTGARPVSVAYGDLDGDGKPDLAVANNNSSFISIFKGTSKNSFFKKVFYER